MSRAVTLTIEQSKALETLYRNGALTASVFDRPAFEQLVGKGMAIKHRNGTSTTYSISGYGRTVYQAL